MLRNAVEVRVKFPGNERYEGVRFNVVIVTGGWAGVKFPGKKRYTTLEWTLRTASGTREEKCERTLHSLLAYFSLTLVLFLELADELLVDAPLLHRLTHLLLICNKTTIGIIIII